MPRTAQASVGGICYHVINRGNARSEVFHKDGDYRAFVELIELARERISDARDKKGSVLDTIVTNFSYATGCIYEQRIWRFRFTTGLLICCNCAIGF